MTVLVGGRVLTPNGWERADVLVEGTRVAAVGQDLTDGDRIDVTGCLVGPAFVDVHTHLREPGQTWKEDIESGSRAAAAGGFGAVVAMPNTEPPIDQPKIVDAVAERGRDVGIVEVMPAGALTAGRAGAVPADLGAMYEAGVRMFTDDGDSVADSELLEEIMKILADLPGAVLAQHAEDSNLTAHGHMHAGEMSLRLGIGGLPTEAEVEIVSRDLDLAAHTGVHYHCQHVSSATTVELIRNAKRDGLDVTAEVTPHHLSFDESALEALDTNFKMYPPLRSAADRAALKAGLADGTIDIVATDHAPHSMEEKAVPFESAPRGVIGLETAAAAVWTEMADRDLLFRAMSEVPARLVGLDGHGVRVEAGSPANLTVFDERVRWTPNGFESKSSNSPYLDSELHGRVRLTMYQGRIVYQIGDNAK